MASVRDSDSVTNADRNLVLALDNGVWTGGYLYANGVANDTWQSRSSTVPSTATEIFSTKNKRKRCWNI